MLTGINTPPLRIVRRRPSSANGAIMRERSGVQRASALRRATARRKNDERSDASPRGLGRAGFDDLVVGPELTPSEALHFLGLTWNGVCGYVSAPRFFGLDADG